jgi:outer membrane protein insertion porin family
LNKIASKLKVGKPMDLFGIRNVTYEMKTLFANDGYPYAQINFELDTAGTDTLNAIRFEVSSDSLVRFGNVVVQGMETLPEYVATRELKMKPGAQYRRDDFLSSKQRLYESGYFSTLSLQMDEKSPDRLRPNFILKVTERKPYYLTFQTGAAQSQTRDLTWDVSAGFGKRNIFRTRRIDLAAYYSFALGQANGLIQHKYDLSYTEPWFLNFRMPTTFTGEVQPKLKSDVQDYDISKWSITVATVKKFNLEVSMNFGFEYQSVTISNIDSALLPSVKQEAGNTIKRRFYFQFRRDSRNDPFIPERGSLTNLSAQYVGGFLGGDDNFKKVEASYSSYQRVWPGWISATRIEGGWIKPFQGSDFVPTDDRLYLGGANTVRGFKEKSLGPVLPDGSPAGANFTTVFNQEFRWRTFPLFKFISERFATRFPLWQSVFVDVGNGFPNSSNFRWDQLAISYGAGIQIVSPAGPIRVDYAQVVPTNGFAFQTHWHFTILYAF